MNLRPYQQPIVDWILGNQRCAVWAPMGAGKTLATLIALSTIKIIEPGPILVIAPKRVAQSTWPDEVKKWAELDLTCTAVVGSERERKRALEGPPTDIYTINIESLPWLIAYWDELWPYRTVVVDESTKLKGFRTRQGTKRAKQLARLAWTKIVHFIELTGTPAPNGLLDLWGQLWFLDKGSRLGTTFKAFTDRWFRSGFGGFNYQPMPHAQRQIEDAVRDLCLTVTLPFTPDAPLVTDILVDLPPEHRKLYTQLERQMFVALANEQEVTAVNAAALSSKCQQLANGAVYDDDHNTHVIHDEKLDALDDIIEEAAGMPVLVAYQFKSDLSRMKARYPQARVLDDDPQTITDWNAGKIPILLMHPKSAGHGLNLQFGGNIIVWFGLTWNLEEYLQAIERIGPMRQWQSGLNRPCFVYRIMARDTVDGLISERLEGKRTVQDVLLDAMRRRK